MNTNLMIRQPLAVTTPPRRTPISRLPSLRKPAFGRFRGIGNAPDAIQTAGTVSRSIGRGFTLIELLVVISIIAILIALLLPALAAARHYAVQVQCLSNMHQTYTACIEYANENEGYFPPGTYDVQNTNNHYPAMDQTDATYQFGGNWKWDTNQIYGPILSPYVGGPSDDAVTGKDPLANYNANDAVLVCAAIMSHPDRAQLYPYQAPAALETGRMDPFLYTFCYGIPSEGSEPAPKYGTVTNQNTGCGVFYANGQNMDFMLICSFPGGNGNPGWGFVNQFGNFGETHDGGTLMNLMNVDGSAETVTYVLGDTDNHDIAKVNDYSR
jgi:prepilin-type N-terminal cleavage/methylation domain-containing protein